MTRSSARFHDSLYDMTKRNTRVLTVSVPPETADDFERIAEAEGRNRSELFREMLRVYRTYEETRTFESLQRSGAAQAARRGIRALVNLTVAVIACPTARWCGVPRAANRKQE